MRHNLLNYTDLKFLISLPVCSLVFAFVNGNVRNVSVPTNFIGYGKGDSEQHQLLKSGQLYERKLHLVAVWVASTCWVFLSVAFKENLGGDW